MGLTADVSAGRVHDCLMTGELSADLIIYVALVGHQLAFANDILANDAADRLCRGRGRVQAADLAAAVDERHHGALAGRAGLLRALLYVLARAEVGLVSPASAPSRVASPTTAVRPPRPGRATGAEAVSPAWPREPGRRGACLRDEGREMSRPRAGGHWICAKRSWRAWRSPS